MYNHYDGTYFTDNFNVLYLEQMRTAFICLSLDDILR